MKGQEDLKDVLFGNFLQVIYFTNVQTAHQKIKCFCIYMF